MAFDVGSIVAELKADTTNFNKGIESAQEKTKSLGGTISKIGSSFAEFGKQAAVFSTIAGIGIGAFLKSSSDEANNFQKAMTTLDIISQKFGVSGDKAKQTAIELGKELRIGTGAAAESIQNLLKSGLNIDQAGELIKRFTNEAITGKSASITLSQAVQNLSFAYATGNSALGNLSGISENFIDITERGRNALIKEGKSAKDITDEMAKLRGMMDLTNLTLGSSERFTGTLVDKQAQLSQKMTELKIQFGQAINPLLADFVGLIVNSGLIEGLGEVASIMSAFIETLQTDDIGRLSELVPPGIAKILGKFAGALRDLGTWISENQQLVMTFLQGFGIALGVILAAGAITMVLTTMLQPITLVALAIAALFIAYQTNFLGIRDIVNSVVTWIVEFWNSYLVPAIEFIKNWWVQNWDAIKDHLDATWKVIKGIIQIAWAIIEGFIKISLAALTGDWGKAWTAIKEMVASIWEGIKNIFSGIVQHIKNWGSEVLKALTQPFSDAWERIKKTVEDIKGALDFTKRHSPSVMDILNKSVKLANGAMENLDFGIGNLTPHANIAPSFATPGGSGSQAIAIHINLDGAVISSESAAQEMSELIGDNIIKRLQQNIRI